MRFRKGKGNADGELSGPPPNADQRVDDTASEQPTEALAAAPPPTSADRVVEPARVLPPDPQQRVSEPIAAPPPQAADMVAPVAPAAAAATCPRCGTPAQPGQEVCIGCGARLYGVEERRRRSWLPIALVALGVLLVGTGAGFGIAELLSKDTSKHADRVASAPTNLTPPVPDIGPSGVSGPSGASGPSGVSGPSGASGPSGTSGPAIPPATREAPVTPGGGSPTPPSGGSSGEPASWPAGQTAYTVVLLSATSRSAADAKARQAIRRGVPAGVLHSDDYSSLNPGYWVVFAGQFDTSDQARKAADGYASKGFGGGYPRQVKK